MDSFTLENKNRFMFAYFKSFDPSNVFKKWEVGFLPIVHTQEDIEQALFLLPNVLRQVTITLIDVPDVLCVSNKDTNVAPMQSVESWP